MKYTKILKGHEKDFKKYIGKEGCNSHEYQQALFDCQIKAVLNIGIGVCLGTREILLKIRVSVV